MRHKKIDLFDQLFNAVKGSTSYGLLGDEVKSDFYLIEPGGIGRCVVDVEARTTCKPAMNLRMLVGCVIVNNQVYIKMGWHILLDLFKKLEEFLMPMHRSAPC